MSFQKGAFTERVLYPSALVCMHLECSHNPATTYHLDNPCITSGFCKNDKSPGYLLLAGYFASAYSCELNQRPSLPSWAAATWGEAWSQRERRYRVCTSHPKGQACNTEAAMCQPENGMSLGIH